MDEAPPLIVEVDSEEGTEALGRAIARAVRPGTVIGLAGPLGAGKTRLSRSIAEALGVDPSAIASPTFVLVHEYEGSMPVYHFDAYRLRSPEEFDALGADEYFGGDGLCLVEWADRVADRLPPTSWSVLAVPLGPTRRRFEVRAPGAAAARVAAEVSGA